MFKEGNIVKNKRDGLYWKVGSVFKKSGTMELWAYNPVPVWYPRWGMTIDVIKDYELAE